MATCATSSSAWKPLGCARRFREGRALRLELQRLHGHVGRHPDRPLPRRRGRAGIVNWQSYYGQNRIDKWMIPDFGASVYADPLIYARSSPITFITRTKTPTLVLQGERDAEVPAPQAYEFWHALKTLGVPTELVIYP